MDIDLYPINRQPSYRSIFVDTWREISKCKYFVDLSTYFGHNDRFIV